MEIIATELRLKDLDTTKKRRDPISRQAHADPTKRGEVEIYDKIISTLESGKDVKAADWNAKEVYPILVANNRFFYLMSFCC